jgi:hypothetical protein
VPRYSHRCKITTNIPLPKTARLWLAWFSAASITNTGGKGSPREGQEEFRRRCTLIASPQFLVAVRAGTVGAFRLQRDEWVGGRTRWFLSVPSSSPPRTRIPRLRPILSGNDVYIKVKQMVYLLDRSGFELGRDFCAAQRLAVVAPSQSSFPRVFTFRPRPRRSGPPCIADAESSRN